VVLKKSYKKKKKGKKRSFAYRPLKDRCGSERKRERERERERERGKPRKKICVPSIISKAEVNNFDQTA
jgi:hypothetical protein